MPRSPEAPGFRLRTQDLGRRMKLRTIFEFAVVGICTVAFALNAAGICTTLLTDSFAGQRDFVTYWSSGHQLVHRANPYDGAAILQMELSTGYTAGLPPLIMRNAPPSLLIVLPLGFLGVRAASLLWTLLMIVSLWLSVRMIAAMHNQAGNRLNILGFTFAPALSCLISGQMALFVLLGLVLFLRLHRTRPFLAGASLWLCALKPQVFLAFGVVLLAWIIVNRYYRILLGAAAAFAFSTAVAMVLDRGVWMHYAQMMRAAELETKLIPCMSTMLRLAINPGAVWIQGVPAALGCVWALVYYLQRRHSWDWIEHGSLLMLVSVAVAPYSWFMDQAALLPAVLHALYRNRSRNLVALLALLSAGIETANFRGVPLRNAILYPWTALVWLAWYLLATRNAAASDEPGAKGIGHEVTTVTGSVRDSRNPSFS
jgi:hypothetical protein